AEVVYPTFDVRIVRLSQIVQGLVAVMVKSPAPDNPTDGLQRFRAGRGQEGVSIEIAMPDRLPGSKRVAKKVERLVRVVPTPVRILAVDDLRLLRLIFYSCGVAMWVKCLILQESRARFHPNVVPR